MKASRSLSASDRVGDERNDDDDEGDEDEERDNTVLPTVDVVAGKGLKCLM